ncbi:HlyC/CorC family transporter [Halofilum ochraceum]|uniref:HlyC/CorC family transporter n=1 Tax=Halofilum ochraceum TaxID=1611323 RepID=UPI000A451004|nr:transporter associated domain-containing protein [Halofilum ochraceum]
MGILMADDLPESSSSEGRSLLSRLAKALGGEPRDRDELLTLLRQAQRRELFGHDALAMIEGVFQVADMQARDIMIPRSRMVVVEADAALDDMLPDIIESGHSRFPVIDDNRDEVVGVLLAKDILRYFPEDQRSRFDLRDILRSAAFVPESKRLNTLLQEFRTSRNHMAIVVDEYGGTAGLITIEDVLEQIVGNIDDEHDSEDESPIHEHGPGRYTVDALTPIDEFNAHFGTDYSDDDFDTIGGLVINQIGHVPNTGETATIDRFWFRILDADSRRIRQLQVVWLDQATGDTAEADKTH